MAQPPARSRTPIAPAALPPPIGRKTATIDGVSLHYLEGGRGDPVLLLHGWPVTAYAWRKVMPIMASRFRLIAPDMPGFGDSGPARSADKKEIARLMRALMRELGHERIAIAGHDMGGPVAYAYAAQWPAEVRRLALLDTGLSGFGIEESKATTAWHMGLAQVAAPLPETMVAGNERAFLDFFFERGMPSAGALSAVDRDEYVRAYSQPGGFGATFDYYRAFPRDAEDNRAFARTKLAMPVLAIAAGRGLRAGAAGFAGVAENVRETVIEESGHHMPDDRPQELARSLTAFFAA